MWEGLQTVFMVKGYLTQIILITLKRYLTYINHPDYLKEAGEHSG